MFSYFIFVYFVVYIKEFLGIYFLFYTLPIENLAMKVFIAFLAISTIVVCEANLFNLPYFGGLTNNIDRRDVMETLLEECGKPVTV